MSRHRSRSVGWVVLLACAGSVWACDGLAVATVYPGGGEDGETVTVAADSVRGAGVVVEASKDEYRQGEEIVLHVRNTLGVGVTALDQQAFCTILGLERWSDPNWNEVRNCLSGTPPAEVALESHTDLTVTFRPSGGAEGTLEPGTYRAVLRYAVGSGAMSGRVKTAVSPSFGVR